MRNDKTLPARAGSGVAFGIGLPSQRPALAPLRGLRTADLATESELYLGEVERSSRPPSPETKAPQPPISFSSSSSNSPAVRYTDLVPFLYTFPPVPSPIPAATSPSLPISTGPRHFPDVRAKPARRNECAGEARGAAASRPTFPHQTPPRRDSPPPRASRPFQPSSDSSPPRPATGRRHVPSPPIQIRVSASWRGSAVAVVVRALRDYDSIPKREPFSSTRSILDEFFKQEKPLIQRTKDQITDYCTTLEGDECCSCWDAYFELNKLEQELPKEEIARMVKDSRSDPRYLISSIHHRSELRKKMAEKAHNSVSANSLGQTEKPSPFPVPDGLPKTQEEIDEEEEALMPESSHKVAGKNGEIS